MVSKSGSVDYAVKDQSRCVDASRRAPYAFAFAFDV